MYMGLPRLTMGDTGKEVSQGQRLGQQGPEARRVVLIETYAGLIQASWGITFEGEVW